MIENGMITKIHHDCKPCDDDVPCESYKGFCSEVLEIAGGSCEKLGIKKGDKVSFNLI